MAAVVISVIFGLGYLVLMMAYVWAWKSLPVFVSSGSFIPDTSVSVIIAARNEEKSIRSCITSILEQNYPPELVEIIVVNDHSTDSTKNIINSIENNRVYLIDLVEFVPENFENNSYKKLALSTAVNKAVNKLVVFTDADCICPSNWLALITEFKKVNNKKIVAGLVQFKRDKGFLNSFQCLDFSGMAIIGAALWKNSWGQMVNGANLAIDRAFFLKLGAYSGNEKLASGDDVFLVEKALDRAPNSVGYLKNRESVVTTSACHSWGEFLQQRIRWGSKSSAYSNWRMKAQLAFVWFFHLMILLSACSMFVTGAFVWPFVIMILCKTFADFVLLYSSTSWFERSDLLWLFLPSTVVHLIYLVWAGTLANGKSYRWKDRQLK